MFLIKSSMAAMALVAVAVVPAMAHITLETPTAKVGSSYKAILRVGHGCDGKATTAVRVRLPEGVISVKPMPKQGWKIEKTQGEYAKAYDYYGEEKTSGVRELTWSGGNLADDEYDEFVFRAYVTDAFKPGQPIAFPVVQECVEGATTRWIEIPAEGKVADDYEHPAPVVTVVDK
jgi:periplasmic copper chaperone A